MITDDYLINWSRVRGYVPISFCDWPGKVTCVLFSGGCNLHCPTCHNYQLAWEHENLPRLNKELVIHDIKSRKSWLDGIVISGGEPTINPHLISLLEELGTIGLPIKLDSNGTNPLILEELFESNLIHTAAIDIKGPFHLYPKLTHDLDPVKAKDNMDHILYLANKYKGRVYFRCTKVPFLTEEDLNEVKKIVPSHLTLLFQEFIVPVRK